MNLHVSPFDPHAEGAPLREWYDLTVESFAVDRPTQPKPTFEAVAGRLLMPTTDLGPARRWIARRDGKLVGAAIVILPQVDNTRLALTEIRVAPGFRRQGVGTAILCSVLPEISRERRDIVSGIGLTRGGAGERWAASLGFVSVQGWLSQVLDVADADLGFRPPAAKGYELRSWTGAAPESVVLSYAQARGAIADAPAGEWSMQSPTWTVQRVRQDEQEIRDRGVERRVVAAVSEATGEVVGLTILEVQPTDPRNALQGDTAVMRGHRGHGLGLALKSEMMRLLLLDHPEIERVITGTAADNHHMQRVNAALGYKTERHMTAVESDIQLLRDRLGRSDQAADGGDRVRACHSQWSSKSE